MLPARSAVLTQTVNQDSTTTKVTSSANPSVYGQSVTFTATVKAASPGSGTPTGTVTFYDGSTNLGSGTLSGGTATLPTTFFVVGSHSITAVYSGDPDFTASTSSALTQTVNQAATTTAVVSSVNPSVYGQSVDLHGDGQPQARPAAGRRPARSPSTFGSTQLGTGTLSGGTASLTTSSPLAVGNRHHQGVLQWRHQLQDELGDADPDGQPGQLRPPRSFPRRTPRSMASR